MCGIAGLIAVGDDVSCGAAKKMADCLRHRGPDDEGYLTWGRDGCTSVWGGSDTDPAIGITPLDPARRARAVIAHRRLSILDLSPAGHQPMSDATGRLWIVFNGEIYNYLELRKELVRLGHRFKTETDTEVLLAALSEWGDAALTRFRGMFAFGALDTTRRELLLARDPFGIKPLYFARLATGSFAFASEIKALTSLPGVSSRLHPESMFQFLRFGLTDHGDRTMFEDVLQVPAASWMRVSLDSGVVTGAAKFWTLPRRTPVTHDPAEAGTIVREALSRSTALHMRSDVPVGSCLSGGLDSTAIVAIASKLMPSATPFGTVSFISDDPDTTEARYVSIAERTYRIKSHRIALSAQDIQADITALVQAQDLPFGTLSIYAQYAVFREAHAQGLTVMLDGQGSDELLGGYNTGVSAAIAERLGKARIAGALRLSRAFDPIGVGASRRTILSALGRFVPAAAAPMLMRAIKEPLCPEWLDGEWFADRSVPMTVRAQGRGRNALDQELRLFTESLSLPQLLRFEDRNSMKFGIESRVPFCDVDFAEAVAGIPSDLLITDSGETKAALRIGFRGLVPNEIIDRRKLGFNTPDPAWFLALKPWLLNLLTSQSERLPFLRMNTFVNALEEFDGSGGDLPNGFWRVVCSILWADAFDATA